MKNTGLSKIHLSRLNTIALLGTMLVVAACQKAPPPPASTEPEVITEAPTGLVKNPIKQAHTADVTRWMDLASNKSPAQIAREEQLEKDLKAAQEAKALAAKTAAVAAGKPIPPAPAPTVVAKAPEAAPQLAPSMSGLAASAPKTVVAAPKPSASSIASSAPEQNVLRILNSVQPKFPTSVARAGITEGVVSAKLHVDPDGKVSQVEIIKSRPMKQFDKEVILAASQWKYAPISKPQVAIVEFSFKLDN